MSYSYLFIFFLNSEFTFFEALLTVTAATVGQDLCPFYYQEICWNYICKPSLTLTVFSYFLLKKEIKK